MATLYRKTPKGQAEIETRAHRLSPRVRGALILVDGQRDSAALAQLVGAQAAESLALLAAEGFVELVGGAAPPPPSAAPTAPVASAAPTRTAEAAVVAPAAAAATPADFEKLRRQAVRALTEIIGPMAEPLAIRMERARTLAELQPLLALAQETIANTRGRQAVADYRSRLGG